MNAQQCKPTSVLTLLHPPCLHLQMLLWQQSLVDREAAQKRDQFLWASEKPKTWTKMPPSWEKKRDKFTITRLVNCKNQGRHKSLIILPWHLWRICVHTKIGQVPDMSKTNTKDLPSEDGKYRQRSLLLEMQKHQFNVQGTWKKSKKHVLNNRY